MKLRKVKQTNCTATVAESISLEDLGLPELSPVEVIKEIMRSSGRPLLWALKKLWVPITIVGNHLRERIENSITESLGAPPPEVSARDKYRYHRDVFMM